MAATFTLDDSISDLGAAAGLDARRVEGVGGVTDEEFNRLWMLGLSSDRSLGKPKEWNGREDGFDTFAFRFANWLSSLPGEVEALLDEASTRKNPLIMANLSPRLQTMSRGVHQALSSMVDGKALDIVKSVADRGNGFERWRRLWAEYRPHTAGRKVSLLEAVMEDVPRTGEDFSTWYHRWQELIRQTEVARGTLIDDDIKCAVALRRAPRDLRDHLVLQTAVVADRFSLMNEIILTWLVARRQFASPSHPVAHSSGQGPAPMDVGAIEKGFGKGYSQKGKFDGKGGLGFSANSYSKGYQYSGKPARPYG